MVPAGVREVGDETAMSNDRMILEKPVRALYREFMKRGREFEAAGKKTQSKASEPGEGDTDIQAAVVYYECARMVEAAVRGEYPQGQRP